MSWANGSSGDLELEHQMVAAFHEAFDLWCKKQKAYGAKNISQAGEAGIALRVNDKLQRLKTLMGQGANPEWEGREDSWLDITVYGIMAILVGRGKWPGMEKDSHVCPYCNRMLETDHELEGKLPQAHG